MPFDRVCQKFENAIKKDNKYSGDEKPIKKPTNWLVIGIIDAIHVTTMRHAVNMQL